MSVDFKIKLDEYISNGDYNNYFILLTNLADEGHHKFQKQLETDYHNKLFKKQIYNEELVTYYKKCSEGFHSYSITHLGYMYYYGIGVDKNISKAIELFEQAIKLGNKAEGTSAVRNAMGGLAFIYEEAKNIPKAIELYEQAIKLGDCYAMTNLATICLTDNNTPKAIELYEQAIILENSSAMNNLAIIYENKGNSSKAIELYERAIKLGNPKAMNNLAIIYKNNGNISKAIELYEQAIKLGNRNAMYNLAIIYATEITEHC